MVDILDVPESDLNPLGVTKSVDDLRRRIQESLIEIDPNMVESVFDQWRVARDQLMRANDLVSKALVRLGSDISTYFVSLENVITSKDKTAIISAEDITSALDDLTHFIMEGTENLAAKRTKRGSKRSQGTSIVRASQFKGVGQRGEFIGQKTVKLLRDGKREIKTLIEFMDAGGGHMVPRYVVETAPAVPDSRLENSGSEVITETIKEVSPKIQRPSLEENK